MRSRLTVLILLMALAAGAVVGYVDSRPTWDDTGITAVAVFLAAGLLASLRPHVAWLIGLAVGTPVFAFNAIPGGNLGSAVAIGIGLAGAGVGYLVGKGVGLGKAPRSA